MPIIRPSLRVRSSGKGIRAFAPAGAVQDRLSDLTALADNPGNLRCRYYVPANAKGPMPLVVVLHGCTQNAAVYDQGSGWSRLADRLGFALLFPEQQRANNAMLCFNWFAPEHVTRGGGEPASIRSMVAALSDMHDIDASRVFVTGLSAGGGMASVMLAAYPEVFAAGAIIAGLPYGCASNVGEAFDCMGGRGRKDGRALGALVRRASSHQGPWPRVQVWQGSADQTVAASNAEAIVMQWADLHGLSATPTRKDTVTGHPRRAWMNAEGATLIEHYEITGMAHGTPLDPGTDEGQSGVAGAHMLDVGVSSTDRIAEFFGIVAPAARTADRPHESAVAKPKGTHPIPLVPAPEPAPVPVAAATGVQKVIEDALRAAGLMR